MNWGKGIAVVLALFIGFIVYLAVTLMSQNVDLESEDYYLREIAYEDEIQALKNGKSGDSVKLEVNENQVIVAVPTKEDYKDVLVEFKRPDNDELDKEFKIEGTTMLTLDKSLFKKGQYNVWITYLSEGKPCLQKEEIYI